MSLGDWLRRRFSPPAEPAGEDAALQAEAGARGEGEPDLGRTPGGQTEPTAGGGVAPGRPGTPAAAEAAEAEIESQEPPPDPAP